METLLMLRREGFDQPCISDYNMYCMNDRASQVYTQMVDQITLPAELNRKELAGLLASGNGEMIVYGYQPLMVSAQCLLKTTGKCTESRDIMNWKIVSTRNSRYTMYVHFVII